MNLEKVVLSSLDAIELMIKSSELSEKIIKYHDDMIEEDDKELIHNKFNELGDMVTNFLLELQNNVKTDIGIIQIYYVFMLSISLSLGYVDRSQEIIKEIIEEQKNE